MYQKGLVWSTLVLRIAIGSDPHCLDSYVFTLADARKRH